MFIERFNKLTSRLNNLKRRYAYHKGLLKCDYDPIFFGIELASFCNLNCTYCMRDPVKARGLGYMSLDNFRKLVKLYPYLINTQLHHHGETFLHPQFNEIMDILKENNLKNCRITTNVTMVNGDKAKSAVQSLNQIIFSFDAPNKEYFERLRVGAKYDECVKNIFEFCRINDSLGHPVTTWISLALSDEVKMHLPEFLDKWSSVVDNIELCQLIDWAGHKTKEAGKLGDVRNVGRRFRCGFPWGGLYIMQDGTVFPCCEWETMPDKAMGNIFKQPLREIWNSKKYQEFRKKHFIGDRAGLYCETCHEPWTAEIDLRPIRHIGFKTFVLFESLSWIRRFIKRKTTKIITKQSPKRKADIWVQTNIMTSDGRGFIKNPCLTKIGLLK